MQSIEREQAEIDFWRTSPHESPESDSIFPVIDKVKDAEIFLNLFQRYRGYFPDRGRILELGGGQGWASCLLKRLLPDAYIVATDISPYAIESNQKWVRLWGRAPDSIYSCNSYATHEADGSVDLVFAFSAAHHFSDHVKSMTELSRILKPSGAAIYFYEPVCSKAFYPAALKRVNKKRPEVPEDLLIPSNIRQQAAASNLQLSVDYYPSTLKRGFIEMNYYKILSWISPLQMLLPATANIVIKPIH